MYYVHTKENIKFFNYNAHPIEIIKWEFLIGSYIIIYEHPQEANLKKNLNLAF